MRRLLGIGECMVELFPTAPGLWRQSFAGDVFNMLWYARACLDARYTVGFHTGLGRDGLSREFETFLQANRIDIGDSPRFDERTLGLYAIHLANGERSFSYWRDTSAARWLAADRDRLAHRIASADLVYLSGITLAILPPKDLDTLYDVLLESREGCTIAFDPNIRPRLWKDARYMRASIERIAALAHMVLPGVEDEALCFGAGSAEDVAKRYLGFGSDRVIVKDGAGTFTCVVTSNWISPSSRLPSRWTPPVPETRSPARSWLVCLAARLWNRRSGERTNAPRRWS